jgi:hypothetical protein
VGDNLELRLFNPEDTDAESQVRFPGRVGGWIAPTRAQRVNLLSQPEGEPVPIADDGLRLKLKPKEIVTLAFERKGVSPKI